MRSLKYLSAVLPLINAAYANAVAGKDGNDGTVIVTETRTVTFCPIKEFVTTCDDHLETTFTWRPDAPDATTTTSKGNGDGTTTSGTGSTSKTTGTGSTTTGTGSTTTGTGSTTSKTTGTGSTTSGTTTTGTGSTTTGTGSTTSGTTTTGTGSTTSGTTTTGTTSTTTTSTSTTKPTSAIEDNKCNANGPRTGWCNGKSVLTDTDEDYFSGKTKEFDLVITDKATDFDGTGAIAGFAINGQTPGEAIVANWGDIVKIKVTNKMVGNATTIHWHGIRQKGTNDQDGVPGVSECGIAPGQSRTYTWHASTYGTGWYHSHLLSQYGGGIRGPIIIHGPASADYDYDMGTVMVDEIYTSSIFEMAKTIARARGPLPQARNYLLNGKNTSPDATKGEASRWVVKEGKKHLFRIINSSAQSAFQIAFDSHKMTVISADFTPVVPYEATTLRIMSGQRYNVIVKADQPKSAYYVRAITQTLCGVTNANNGLGVSNGIMEYEGSSISVPALASNATYIAAICEDEPLAGLVPVVVKTAGSVADFTASAKKLPGGLAAQITYDNVGAINRWYFGGQTDLYSSSNQGDKYINVTFQQPTLQLLGTVGQPNSSIYSNAVILDNGETWAYFVIQNNFVTSHPMHLHGHDFSVLGQSKGKIFDAGDVAKLNFVNPVRRDTVLLFGAGAPTAPTPGYTVIGFKTDNPGAWLMHCHIIWHADAGMGLQFIERPSEINASKYINTDDFKNECKAMQTYEAQGPEKMKAVYEAGIKRHLEEHKFNGYAHGHAVRHV